MRATHREVRLAVQPRTYPEALYVLCKTVNGTYNPSVESENPITIISADCHACAPLLAYCEYSEKSWWDDFDAWAASFFNPLADLDEVYADRNWGSAKRLRHFEEDGIVAEVVFPNTVPPFYPTVGTVAGPPSPLDYDRRWAGLQHTTVG
jgi:hypothetical protein